MEKEKQTVNELRDSYEANRFNKQCLENSLNNYNNNLSIFIKDKTEEYNKKLESILKLRLQKIEELRGLSENELLGVLKQKGGCRSEWRLNKLYSYYYFDNKLILKGCQWSEYEDFKMILKGEIKEVE